MCIVTFMLFDNNKSKIVINYKNKDYTSHITDTSNYIDHSSTNYIITETINNLIKTNLDNSNILLTFAYKLGKQCISATMHNNISNVDRMFKYTINCYSE